MSAQARKFSSFDIYHVVIKGIGGQYIFEDASDRWQYLNCLNRQLVKRGCDAYAWALMGNHAHLLLRAEHQKLPDLMRSTNSSYVKYFNARHARVGNLLSSPYFTEPIESESHFMQAVLYIHLNPVKAGMAREFDCGLTSYTYFVRDLLAPVQLDVQFVFSVFGGEGAFAEFHAAGKCFGQFYEPTFPARDKQFDCRALADEILGEGAVYQVRILPPEERKRAVCALLDGGLQVREVERLTGISRSAISRMRKQSE